MENLFYGDFEISDFEFNGVKGHVFGKCVYSLLVDACCYHSYFSEPYESYLEVVCDDLGVCSIELDDISIAPEPIDREYLESCFKGNFEFEKEVRRWLMKNFDDCVFYDKDFDNIFSLLSENERVFYHS